jgi:3-deoxy-D-manno-octulosonic-acid transferase
MKRFFYDISLFILLIFFFPKFLIDFFIRGKYRKSLFARLHPEVPKDIKKPVVWLHGVSMGETRALSTLVPYIRKAHPDAFIFITTVTETGQEQAEKCIPDANAIQYLPLDFSWIIKSFVQMLKPKLLILVEGDYWYNLMREVKQTNGSIVVVNGKMSEKSMKRYLFFKSLSHSLFSSIDHFCLQSESYLSRFLKLGIPPEKIAITGNLKFDIPSPEMGDLETYKKELSLKREDVVITLGSTHEGEEDLLLNILETLQKKCPNLKVLLVPRHPERFSKVKRLALNYSYVSVIDKMGVLPQCYRISDLAIVGGSFVRGVGGHDIFEPIKMGVPTLFGPFMHKQKDLMQLVTNSGGGKMLSLEALLPTLEELLSERKLLHEMSEKGKYCAQKALGSAFRTWKEVEPLLI